MLQVSKKRGRSTSMARAKGRPMSASWSSGGRVLPTTMRGRPSKAASPISSHLGSGTQSSSVKATTDALAVRHPTFRFTAGPQSLGVRTGRTAQVDDRVIRTNSDQAPSEEGSSTMTTSNEPGAMVCVSRARTSRSRLS
ncbi:MAG TPA: hypothetical protein DCQ30_12930 [Acidimicrobiaceae bacterium]|nr:hypothetical protein [Acidimicrobiaceae bacterium]